MTETIYPIPANCRECRFSTVAIRINCEYSTGIEVIEHCSLYSRDKNTNKRITKPKFCKALFVKRVEYD